MGLREQYELTKTKYLNFRDRYRGLALEELLEIAQEERINFFKEIPEVGDIKFIQAEYLSFQGERPMDTAFCAFDPELEYYRGAIKEIPPNPEYQGEVIITSKSGERNTTLFTSPLLLVGDEVELEIRQHPALDPFARKYGFDVFIKNATKEELIVGETYLAEIISVTMNPQIRDKNGRKVLSKAGFAKAEIITE